MRIAFTFPQGESVALGASKGGLSGSAAVGSWGNTAAPPPPGPSSDALAGFAAADWSLSPAQEAGGDILMLDIAAVPSEPGQTPEFFEYEAVAGGGSTVATVPWWINTALPRRIRVAPGQASSLRLRVAWRDDSSGAVVRGPWSAAKTATPAPGPARLVFASDHLSGHAGGSFHVEAEGLGFGVLEPYSDLRYKWTLPAGATPLATAMAGTGFPWPDGVIYGPFCVVNFQTPGVYALSCEATDGVTTVTDTVTITVTAWAGHTAWISSAGDFTGAPAADALNTRHASIDAAKTAHNNKGRDIRYLLRAGESHGAWGTLQGNGSLIVGSWGGGRATNLAPGGEACLKVVSTTGELIVSDLAMIGPYDCTAPDSISGSIPEGIIQQGGEGKKTLHNLHLDGFSINFEPLELKASDMTDADPRRKNIGSNIHLTNCSSTNWLNMGILCSATRHFYVAGCSMKQKAGAMNDATSKALVSPCAPWHGPIRFSRPRGPVAVVMSEFGSWNGWGSIYEHQPCLRWNAEGSDSADKLFVGQCRTEGSAFASNPNNQNTPYPQRFLWDKIHHIATTQPDAAFSCAYGGAVLRNLIAVQGNVPSEEAGKSMRSGLKFEKEGANRYMPSLANGITFIDLRNDANSGGQAVDEVFGEASGWTYRNLAILIPNRSVANIGDGPFDLTGHWTPGYVGRRVTSEAGGALQTQFANGPETAVIPVPQAGAGVVGSQDGPPPLDDFYGRLRPTDGSAARGALEP